MKRKITNRRRNQWGEIIGDCEGRPVKFTFATGLWYFLDGERERAT